MMMPTKTIATEKLTEKDPIAVVRIVAHKFSVGVG
jgi:hypothetical protein